MTTNNDFSQKAIQSALNQDWQTAIELNQKILESESTNIPALNRLGRAYLEMGQPRLAKKAFMKVLDIDKHNSIAQNSLERIKLGSTSGSANMSNFSFLEEPGKTKTVSLYKLAPHTTLAKLVTSQIVTFKTNARSVAVQTLEKKFIGYLPDDLAVHLTKLIKMGNEYEAAIKTVNKSKVEIFIRETKQATKLKGIPSFTSKDTSRYYQFLPTDPVAETPMEIEIGEEEEMVI